MFPKTPKLAVIGLGYVGLPLAVEFARHFDVVGFDINAGRIEELGQGRDSTREVDAQDLEQASRLRFSSRLEDIADCDIYIVTVPTPIDQARRPDLRPLIAASKTVGQVLKPGNIVIYESTVYPGCTEEDCVPVLEEVSGLKCAHEPSEPGIDRRPYARTVSGQALLAFGKPHPPSNLRYADLREGNTEREPASQPPTRNPQPAFAVDTLFRVKHFSVR